MRYVGRTASQMNRENEMLHIKQKEPRGSSLSIISNIVKLQFITWSLCNFTPATGGVHIQLKVNRHLCLCPKKCFRIADFGVVSMFLISA